MNMNEHNLMRKNRGVGLIEVMISVIIAMLLVLVIYQVYEISEGQKRTITGGSDAQQNASYGMYVLGRDLAMAGNGIASSATALAACPFDADNPGPWLSPVPVVINSGASGADPDTITVLYGGSSSLSTPVPFRNDPAPGGRYDVPGPVGFSENDVIVAVRGAKCAVSTINVGGVQVDATGVAMITHTLKSGDVGETYTRANGASLVNLGQQKSMGRITYSVPAECNDKTKPDPAACSLRTQNRLPTDGPVVPVISDVVNVKAQYGIGTDTNADGIPDTITSWEDSDGTWWQGILALAPTDPNRLQQLRRLLAVRIAIVTRSTQCELDKLTHECIVLTPGPLPIFEKIFEDKDKVEMKLAGDQQHYRYKVLSTVVPLRNALWNSQ